MQPTRIAIGIALVSVSLLRLSFCSGLETFEHALKRHNIEISRASLIEALQNPDKEVRGLAAAELADLKMTDTLPDIVRAAEYELDPGEQVNIAAAATWMDSKEGLNILKTVCNNSAASFYIRIDAARNVFFRQDHSCFPTLVELMSSPEPEARIGALNIASQIHDKTNQETPQVQSMVLQALQDQNLRVRLEVCEVIRWLNNPAFIQPLRDALEKEHEEVVRSPMQSTLDLLIKHQSEPSTANR